MDQNGRGRGRARGRGQAPASMRRPGEAPPNRGPAPAAAPPAASAWGPRPGAGAPQRGPSAPQQQQQQQQSMGVLAASMRQMALGGAGPSGVARSGGAGSSGRGTGGNGDGAARPGGPGGAAGPAGAAGSAPVGRGSMRGRREIASDATVRTRPDTLMTKIGKGGLPAKLQANYFRLLTVPDWQLYQYRVDIAPEEDRTVVRKALVRDHRQTLGGYLFDGTMLYTSQRLTPDDSPRTFTSSNRENQIFQITMRRVGDLVRSDFGYIQVFNMLMRTCLAGLELQLVGRDYYDQRAKVPVPEHRLELWPGYKTSIRQHENEVLMCVEITHKVMRKQTVLDVLQECFQGGGDFRRAFLQSVVGSVVLTEYNNKTYRVDDVDFNSSPASTFSRGGQEVTYASYMWEKYQYRVRDMKQPMLVSRARARDIRAGIQETIYLIPEVCFMTGLTDSMRANFQLMRALATHTRVAPDTRIQKLLAFNQRLLHNERTREELSRWNMQLDKTLVQINGRVVEEEKIIFGKGRSCNAGSDVDWTRGLKGNALLEVIPLTNWVVLVPQRLSNDARQFVNHLLRAANAMQFHMTEPVFYDLPDDRPNTYVGALSSILDSAKPQLVMCIAMNNRGDRYSAIKKKCCVDRAVPTQVILAKNLNSKATMSVASKVAIQMNCKVGGAPWTVEVPLSGLMVVGFDVCHDTTNKAQSYGAMVASLNKSMTRYYSAVSAHTHGEELSNHLAVNILKAVNMYKDCNNGSFPQRILIYRDGVGEGQIPYVHSTEVEVIKKKLAEAYGNLEVKMTFVVVTKRINTRIFRGNSNPVSGTVVDDVITDPLKYDFFLVSQSVRDGTVSPTSYNVLYDGMNLPAERLQRLTYKMCHMYFNWSGTVRVPAPCQYAHKLAFLVGQALHREPSDALSNLLYFL